MSSISGSDSSVGFSSGSYDSYDSYDSDSSVDYSADASSESSTSASDFGSDSNSAVDSGSSFEADAHHPIEENPGPVPATETFGLPENATARSYVMAGEQDGYIDDGLSCRPDPDSESTVSTRPVQGSVTVQNGQGVLSALQSAGVPKENLNAAYGSLVANGQLGEKDFEGATPIVKPGRQFQLDSADFTPENARLGGRLIGNEHASRVAADVAAMQNLTRGTQAERDADPAYQMALQAQKQLAARPQGTALEVAPPLNALERLRDQTAATTLIMAQPVVKAGASVASWVGFDVNPDKVGDDMFGAASDLISQSKLAPGAAANKVLYKDAMGQPVAAVGIEKYDETNITYHDYRLDTRLCNRSEAFCTIPNLSPLVDHSSAPKAGWTGFTPMENGPQKLIMGHPIIHSSDYQKGHFVNQTESAHIFHSGTVESQLYWKGDELHLKTVGYGYGQTPLHTVANYGIGLSYFGPWQMVVKAQVQAMRMSQ